MKYSYKCDSCNREEDIYKNMSDYDREEKCSSCSAVMSTDWTKYRITLSKTSVQNAEYNLGLGCVTKNAEHRAEIAKRKGVVEIGNDYVSGEAMQKESETKREIAREKSWEDL